MAETMEAPMKNRRFESDPIPESVHEGIAKAEKLADQNVWGRVHQVITGVLNDLDPIGVESAYCLWLAAVASDSIGNLAEAVRYIASARAVDPVFSRGLSSERIILGKVFTLIDVAGVDDLEVQCLVEIVRASFPPTHPGLKYLENKLAEANEAGETSSTRAQA
jgi:hypothetical protein